MNSVCSSNRIEKTCQGQQIMQPKPCQLIILPEVKLACTYGFPTVVQVSETLQKIEYQINMMTKDFQQLQGKVNFNSQYNTNN